jgi:hypothetical protein
VTDSATVPTPEADDEDLGDLLLEVLPPDGSTMGNLPAREALSRAAERPISEQEREQVRDRALALGLIRRGRGRGGSIALAEGIEGGSRYEAPAATSTNANGRGRAKKEAPALNHLQQIFWLLAGRRSSPLPLRSSPGTSPVPTAPVGHPPSHSAANASGSRWSGCQSAGLFHRQATAAIEDREALGISGLDPTGIGVHHQLADLHRCRRAEKGGHHREGEERLPSGARPAAGLSRTSDQLAWSRSLTARQRSSRRAVSSPLDGGGLS